MKRLLALSIATLFSATVGAQSTLSAEDALREAKTKEAAAKELAAQEEAAKKAAAARAAERKRRQEMVQSTTGAAATQYSVAPNRGPAPPGQADKLSKEERKEVMQGAMQSAGSQYGPSAGTAATKVDPNAPKVAKPDPRDPAVQKALQKAATQ